MLFNNILSKKRKKQISMMKKIQLKTLQPALTFRTKECKENQSTESMAFFLILSPVVTRMKNIILPDEENLSQGGSGYTSLCPLSSREFSWKTITLYHVHCHCPQIQASEPWLPIYETLDPHTKVLNISTRVSQKCPQLNMFQGRLLFVTMLVQLLEPLSCLL